MTSYNFFHILSARSESQVLATLKGRGFLKVWTAAGRDYQTWIIKDKERERKQQQQNFGKQVGWVQTDSAGLRKLNMKPEAREAKKQAALPCRVPQETWDLAAPVSIRSEVKVELNRTVVQSQFRKQTLRCFPHPKQPSNHPFLHASNRIYGYVGKTWDLGTEGLQKRLRESLPSPKQRDSVKVNI